MREGVTTLVRSIIAFYAATVGFGLSHLLALVPSSPVDPVLVAHRWPYFLIIAILALRLLSGSSAHLGAEYPSAKPVTRSGLFSLDVSFLLIFGYLALRAAYAQNVNEFWMWCWWLGLAPLIGAISIVVRGKEQLSRWWPFLLFDVVIVLTISIAWNYVSDQDIAGWSTAAISFALVVLEIPWQLRAADKS